MTFSGAFRNNFETRKIFLGLLIESFLLKLYIHCSLTVSEVPQSYIRHEDFRLFFCPALSATLTVPPLDSETGWTGELWSKTNFLNC